MSYKKIYNTGATSIVFLGLVCLFLVCDLNIMIFSLIDGVRDNEIITMLASDILLIIFILAITLFQRSYILAAGVALLRFIAITIIRVRILIDTYNSSPHTSFGYGPDREGGMMINALVLIYTFTFFIVTIIWIIVKAKYDKDKMGNASSQ